MRKQIICSHLQAVMQRSIQTRMQTYFIWTENIWISTFIFCIECWKGYLSAWAYVFYYNNNEKKEEEEKLGVENIVKHLFRIYNQ